MKKLSILTMFAAIILASCGVEPIGDENLEGIYGKGKNKEKVSEPCDVSVTPNLPSIVSACTTEKGENTTTNSYFDLTINDTFLAGNYGAWCVDVDLSLGPDSCFEADVYSSYSDLPAGKFEHPENFDLINWIYNQNFIGSTSPSGGTYTFGDLQWAIWELVDDKNCAACSYLGNDWSTQKGQEIVDLAIANGENYEPGAGEFLAVLLIPTNNMQSVFIPYLLECDTQEGSCDTAFARDTNGENCFIDNGFSRWGWSLKISEPGDYSYDIYAGAGQCDISKGALVGTVDVSYGTDGSVDVTYNIDSSYTVSETHTYAGKEMFPTTKKGEPTVAPGQFKIESNLDGEIYVIAHAVVCN